jgi:hypothetical protein
MSAKLSPEEVATVIKARKILNAQGLAPDTARRQGYLAKPVINGPTS